MSAIDVFLDGLGDDARAAMRALVAKAYERGFREGLSTAGAPVPIVAVATAAVPQAPPAPPVVREITGAPIAVPVPHDEPESAGVNWTEGDDSAPDDEPAEADAPRPIMVHATIGTLLRRIERTFALDRFDIDVVVFRRGDREKRQLKANVRLKNYVRER